MYLLRQVYKLKVGFQCSCSGHANKLKQVIFFISLIYFKYSGTGNQRSLFIRLTIRNEVEAYHKSIYFEKTTICK